MGDVIKSKLPPAKTIAERMKKAAGVTSYGDLGKILNGITSQAISAAIGKDAIPAHWFDILQERFGVSREELCRPLQRVTSALEIDLALDQDQEEKTPIHKLLVMTTGILESNTVYSSALAANIRAFHRAVEGEKEMSDLREKMDQMLSKMDEMEKQLADLRGVEGDEKKRAGNDH